jgi:hypothetical protein
MQIERDEDTFDAIKNMAENIDLASRNYNDELIAIDYYKNLTVLTKTQLQVLEQLWHHKVRTCYKEMLASRWMVLQILLLLCLVMYIAWISGGHYVGIIAGIFSISGMIAMIEDKRVSIAKKNYLDAIKVHHHILNYLEQKAETHT